MSRYVRKTAILAKIESAYGTDAVPTGAANAILVSNQNIIPLNAQNVDRDLIRNHFGASEQLVGSAYVECSFDVEIQSSGAAGTAPAFGPLLRACGMAETVTASTRVEYNPITNGMESATVYYYSDGALHKLLGARGSYDIKMNVSQRPVFSFRFIGIDGGVTAAANPSLTLSAFKTPAVVTDPNTEDLLLGCTYSAGALSGGTAYVSQGLEISSGIDVQFIPLLGEEKVEITNRAMTGKVALELTAAQEVTFMTNVKANTTQSIGLQHGSAAGYISILYAPKGQLINPSKVDVNGLLLNGYDVRLVPDAGNDELYLCFK